jgi:DNA-binding IclR family transcriptional regulator
MAEYDYNQLKHSTVADLREIASELDQEAVKGYTQLNKEHLIELLCKVLNIDMHVHHEVVGIDKSAIKKRIKELKVQRDAALEAKDHKKLKEIRRKIHRQNRKIRRAMV